MRTYRRLLALLLCLLPLCAAAQLDWFSPEREEALKASSLQLLEQMEEGQFDEVVALFSPDLARQVSALQLRLGLMQVRQQAGAFEGLIGAHAFEDGQAVIIDAYARHEKAALRLRLPYSEAGELIGIWIGAAPEAEIERAFGEDSPSTATGEHGVDHAVTIGAFNLPGRLVIPKDPAADQGIAVLLVPGSGPSDMDETFGAAGNKPLRDIADALAARGIASLRYDKRSLAAPDSFDDGVTIQAEVLEDVQAAVSLLSQHPLTSQHELYLVGHSLGGMLAPQILTDNPQLRGAVILAGTPRSLWDVIYDQGLAALQQNWLEMREQQNWNEGAQAMGEGIAKAALIQARDLARKMTKDNQEEAFGLPGEYIVSLNELNLADKALDLNQPLLILQGEQDQQVYADKDFVAWRDLLGEREQVSYKLYPWLNHMFMTGATGTMADYDDPAQVDPQVTQDMADWMKSWSARD